jgi:hypothetical protein
VLRELGYVEGQNLVVERRYAEGKTDRLPGMARELVQLRVDVIVAVSTGVEVAKEATKTIPIVMGFATDPTGRGFVASLARPGGNITGVSYSVGPEIHQKRLELLKEAVPRSSNRGPRRQGHLPEHEAGDAAGGVIARRQADPSRSPGRRVRARSPPRVSLNESSARSAARPSVRLRDQGYGMHPETLHERRLDRPQREEEGQPGHTRRALIQKSWDRRRTRAALASRVRPHVRPEELAAFTASAPLPAREAVNDAARLGS